MNNDFDIEHDDAAITAKLRDFIDEIRAIDLENKALDRRRRDLYKIAAEFGFNAGILKESLAQIPARLRQRRAYSLNIWKRSAAARPPTNCVWARPSPKWHSGLTSGRATMPTPSATPTAR